MKKSKLILSALLVVCVLPKIVGYKINSSLNEVVETINSSASYRAEIITVDSGWLSTTANIQLGFDASSDDTENTLGDENPSLQIVFNASHGPVRLGEKAGIGWAAWSVDVAGKPLREFIDWDKSISFYQMDGSAGLLGSVSYSDAIPAFTADIPAENIHIDFSGYQGSDSEQADSAKLTVIAPQGNINASLNASLVGIEALSASFNDKDFWLEHALVTADIQGDKAAIEFVLETFFKKQYEDYKFPSQMSNEEIKMRADNKMQFALAMLARGKLLKTTDSHYSTAINLKDKQLTVHKKVISL